jgi:23S rRNA (uracil1939-C5)-methyltransferase
MMKPQPLKGKISSFAFGGSGILKTDEDMVVFIPFTAPNESVSYEIVKQKKRYAEGKLLQVLEPSPHRIEPRCPYFTTCGGCQLQHLDYPYQATLKKQAVQEALQRVYPEVETEMVPATSAWSYRRRIHLTLKPLDKGFAVGYISYDNESLVEVDQCPIFLPAKDLIFKQVREIAKQFDSEPSNSGKAALIKMDDQGFLLHFHFKKAPKNAEKVLKEALKLPLSGIFLSAPGKEFRFGEESLTFALDHFSFRYTPRAFIQNHPEESALIYHAIREEVKATQPPVLLDLYSGIGITSLLAADYAGKIEAIEANREAIKLSQQNAEANGKKISFHLGLVEKKLPEILSKKPFMAISNPPREGMEPSACTMLAESSIQKLIYISCHPATLARDLNVFKANGFILKKSRAYDMFPQTGHVETVAFLEKKIRKCYSD